MEIIKLAIPLTLSRIGEIILSFLYFSFIGHIFVNTLEEASIAWALVSFLTVLGIGFFSPLVVRVAGASVNNKAHSTAYLQTTASLHYALAGGTIVALLAFAFLHASTPAGTISNHTPLLLLTSLPAIYIQTVIFNFFNATGKPKLEIIFTTSLNCSLLIYITLTLWLSPSNTVLDFIVAYSTLRWIHVGFVATLYYRELKKQNIALPSNTSKLLRYKNIFKDGVPMAVCFAGESAVYLIITLIAKTQENISLPAYQASLHFMTFVYMVSIGSATATGILTARDYKKELKRKFCIDFRNGMICGAVLLMPLITACLFLGDFIASLYTSDPEIKLDIAKCLTASTPFLICEYIYIVTRSTLRSMLDFWIPTLMSIASLNFIGIGLIYSLIDTSPDPLLFIYYSLSFSSFILMLLLLWRFRAKYNQFSCNCAQRMRED